ncbi:IMP dehydrogenase [Erysipelothrix rhusiopathiae]|uniref:Inosine-5'-monophosphate dehydrogenase n=2 Tax=Erysipelothrix rhusiopathiae TaxID=1648 RepID=E7FVR1_ERYRH|nr:IMP dehydrogenase [Erysipelothrix rhusiopathiae]AMS10662.1 guanosine monophosphate reductase [Erysipelothrix rhusiopathiae]AOO66996.1 guanosine monophosphate reductase [Erysipelothrix rhusiopathiae]AWU41979.1 guanosine monophosphate reductase [Erysipelothrix rhusiopathiae]EFY08981.1 putative inosine-5'-monophosphate dehydrogenase [Erysipelothrix rhusiopathiae ATCC 19414]MDE8032223.1 IMP dehydrogenase [Erysipelothrix rhusiopathiae]
MNMMNGKVIKEAYTFDDLLLVPAKSEVVPAQVKLQTRLTDKITLNIPIVSAAMDTVTEDAMAIMLAKLGGMGFVHKNMPVEAQAAMIKAVKETEVESSFEDANIDPQGRLRVGAAVGVGESSLERVRALVDAGVDIVAVDSAHGHSQGVIDTVRMIRAEFPELDIVGGNIVTAQGATDLIYAGANVIKVGVGPGSICTTRVVAGVGVPQLTAVNDVYSVARQYGVGVIADGGIKLSGDIAKALAAGGSCVMLGGLLAGTEETPGEVMEVFGKKVKGYVGMGSLSAMQRGSSDRYFQGGVSELKKLVPEGIEATVPFKGSIRDVIYQMLGGLRSGMGYCGCGTIEEMHQKAQFVKITGAGLRESHPHDVDNVKEAPNYHGK